MSTHDRQSPSSAFDQVEEREAEEDDVPVMSIEQDEETKDDDYEEEEEEEEVTNRPQGTREAAQTNLESPAARNEVPFPYQNDNVAGFPPRQSLCFTYPQGDASFLPAVFTFMATFAALQAFPAMNLFMDEFNFLCYELSLSAPYSQQTAYESVCSPLYLGSDSYWNTVDDNEWAGALKVAALFGILAGILGSVLCAILASASCFALSAYSIHAAFLLQLVCGVCTIMTLTGGAADACAAKQNQENRWCSKDKVRIDTGAGFMIFSFFLFCVAAFPTYQYLIFVRTGIKPGARRGSNHRRNQGWNSPQEMQSLTQTATPIQMLGGLTETRTILPSGETRIEREYLEETGQLVREVTVQQPQNDPVAQSAS